MLRFGSHIAFVDPFYDPFDVRYKNTFRACLDIIESQIRRRRAKFITGIMKTSPGIASWSERPCDCLRE